MKVRTFSSPEEEAGGGGGTGGGFWRGSVIVDYGTGGYGEGPMSRLYRREGNACHPEPGKIGRYGTRHPLWTDHGPSSTINPTDLSAEFVTEEQGVGE